MKVLLVAINAKYIHSNLAVYTLKAYGKKMGIDVEIAEYTINNYEEEIMADIYKKRPDFIGFSCYIWNIEYVNNIARELKKVLPSTHIWYGGPEVSYESEDYLREHKYIDGIMIGEGEESLCELINMYEENKSNKSNKYNKEMIGGKLEDKLKEIKGIVIRKEDTIVNTGVREYIDIDRIPFPYEHISDFENRIIYYESSRGCPYSCSYCMSSIDKRVRYRSIDLVKKELRYFIDNNVKQVKFVDRTFNCNKQRTLEIWKYIKEHDNGITNFHFEISADILSDEEIDMMCDMRPRLIQLEIGVQSTNVRTIQAIKRKMDFDKLANIVNRINETHKVHQHLDLIAGLPYEDMESFKESFNDVYRLKPEQLQLGFLKVLKGSLMHKESKKYGIVYNSNPVYEVLYTDWLSYDDILQLKQIEEMLEVYYNSRQFETTIEYLVNYFSSPYEMYEYLGKYYEKRKLFDIKHSRISRYIILLDICEELFSADSKEYCIVKQLLKHDLYLRENIKSRPDFAGSIEENKKKYNEFYKNEKLVRSILPNYGTYDTKQIARLTHIEEFDIDIIELNKSGNVIEKKQYILYDYLSRNPINYQATIYNIDI